MSEKLLIPSIEKRLGALLESTRRKEAVSETKDRSGKNRPTITISREFGCEAYPMAERLRELMEKKTKESWILMDKALLEEVALNHNLSEEMLQGLGEKTRFLDEIIATFSPSWRTEKDHYRLLCRHIMSLANMGNVIIMGQGSAIITKTMKNCHHFRMYATTATKTRSIARRLGLSDEEAEKLMSKKQQKRDRFVRDFLNQDAKDLSFYHLVFNCDKNTSERISHTIMEYVLMNNNGADQG